LEVQERSYGTPKVGTCKNTGRSPVWRIKHRGEIVDFELVFDDPNDIN
jgi:hypothetical protein